MKKNSQRKPKPKTVQRAAAAAQAVRRALGQTTEPAASEPSHSHAKEERKIGVVSGTPADAFDETSERKRDKWVAIYISVLAVLLAIAATGSNDAMKTAQQAGFQVNDQYAFYQAKTIRQSQLKVASNDLDLRVQSLPNMPEAVRNRIQADKAEYDKEIGRLESNARNGKKELLALAESCENERNQALAQHPFYDYSLAMLQIAIVLASASIITGTRILLFGSGAVGLLGILFFLNGYALFFGAPTLKHDKADALEQAGIHIPLKCVAG
ncbi:MAG: DUF4337 domain-containing protein [Rhodomicrobium sp.]